jgi:ssDNA thymidine ADP-ribosyltransferase DarT-like protein
MLRTELTDLHFITPIDNLASILAHGILSHNQMVQRKHVSVAMQAVQDRRAVKVVPGARRLHDYANLYMCARNPMMFLRRGQHESLCVLSISPAVLDVPGTVITDQNAASDYVRFAASPDGLVHVDHALTFARNWTHPDDQIAEWRHKAAKCAEVLVPDSVQPDYIRSVYVSGDVGRQRAVGVQQSKPVQIYADIFFL